MPPSKLTPVFRTSLFYSFSLLFRLIFKNYPLYSIPANNDTRHAEPNTRHAVKNTGTAVFHLCNRIRRQMNDLVPLYTARQKKAPTSNEIGASRSLTRADDGNRTRDLLTTNEVRYRLCHISKLSPLRLFILPQVLRFVKHIFQFFYFFERGRFQTPLAQNQIPHLSKSMSRYTIAIK